MFRPDPQLARQPSLIRLTSLLAIVVVCTVAWPAYNDHMERAHRAQVRAALLNAAQWMERTARAAGGYPSAAAIPGEVLRVEGGRYVIAVLSNDGVTYTFTALPNAAQSSDLCGAYRINQAGMRMQVATAEVPQPLGSQECWSQ